VVVVSHPAVVYRTASPPVTAATAETKAIKDLADEVNALRKLLKKLGPTDKQGSWQAPAPARVTVELPANARLFVNGVACPLTSERRSFQSPDLQPGQEYSYTLRAELQRNGQTLTRTQRVRVAAGREVRVSFDFSSELTSAGR
jgi:uncharacterized protein (TIGR03000 family)